MRAAFRPRCEPKPRRDRRALRQVIRPPVHTSNRHTTPTSAFLQRIRRQSREPAPTSARAHPIPATGLSFASLLDLREMKPKQDEGSCSFGELAAPPAAVAPPRIKKTDPLALDKLQGNLLYPDSMSDITARNGGVLYASRTTIGTSTYVSETVPLVDSQFRPTYFTYISAANERVAEAAERKNHLKQYFSLRVVPGQVAINDYEPGKKYQATFKIQNFSNKSQKVTLHPPRSRYFTLVGKEIFKDMQIAPGIEAEAKVEFSVSTALSMTSLARSPHGSLQSLQTQQPDSSSAEIYSDKIQIDSDACEPIVVTLHAYPAAPVLRYDRCVDFGVVVARRGAEPAPSRPERKVTVAAESSASNSVTEISKSIESLSSRRDSQETIPAISCEPVVTYLQIRNVGRVNAQFNVIYDHSLPLRITPTSVTLGANVSGSQDHCVLKLGESTKSKRARLPSSCELKIELFPRVVGVFREDVLIDISGQTLIARKPKGAAATLATDAVRQLRDQSSLGFIVSAVIVPHKLRLQNIKGTFELDPNNIHFGSIYYSQVAKFPAKLENRSTGTLKWVITHAGQSAPMVPSQKDLLGQHSRLTGTTLSGIEENRAFVSVVPTEGILEPNETTIIVFQFAPSVTNPLTGFKISRSDAPQQLYRVPMQLKIIDSSSQQTPSSGEEPIDLLLTGEACPIRCTLSNNEIDFPDTFIGNLTSTEISLHNSSERLGLNYRFDKVAHFTVSPSHGHLKPMESTSIAISFKPHQLGFLKRSMHCIISSTDPLVIGSASGYNDLIDTSQCVQELKTIEIRLQGSCVAKSGSRIAPRPLKECDAGEARAVQVAKKQPLYKAEVAEFPNNISQLRIPSIHSKEMMLDQWQDKSSNRHRFADYLRDSRTERVKKGRSENLGDDGVVVDYQKHSVYEDYHNTDPQTGLKIYEPVCKALKYKSPASVDNIDDRALFEPVTSDNRKLRLLFQKLMEPVVHKLKPTLISKDSKDRADRALVTAAASDYDTALSSADLKSIFTGKATLEFGQVTVHSTNTLPLNFLNITPNKAPIHISMLPSEFSIRSDDVSGNLSVAPTHLVIPPMSVAGFEVNFQCDTPGNISKSITYLVNGRYKYQIPVGCTVAPVNLEISEESLEFYVRIRGSPGSAPTGSLGGISSDQGVDSSVTLAQTSAIGSANTASTHEARRMSNLQAQLAAAKPVVEAAVPSTSKTIRLSNKGNYRASFQWFIPTFESGNKTDDSGDKVATLQSQTSPASPFTAEGFFRVSPMSGTVEPHSEVEVQVSYTPGIKHFLDDVLQLRILDDADEGSSKIKNILSLPCHGETDVSTCNLLTSTKQGPLDLGTLATGFDRLSSPHGARRVSSHARRSSMTSGPGPSYHLYNKLFEVIIGAPVGNSSSNTKIPPRGSKIVRIKNPGSSPCFFHAHTATANLDVTIHPQFGIIAPGTIAELMISVLPSRTGVCEDSLVINLIGNSKVLRVPFKYDGKSSDVSIQPVGPDLERGTIIGSWSSRDLNMSNRGMTASRILFDLRKYPDYEIRIKSIFDGVDASTSAFNRISSPMNRNRAKSPGAFQRGGALRPKEDMLLLVKQRIKAIGYVDDYFNFDGTFARSNSVHQSQSQIRRPDDLGKRRSVTEREDFINSSSFGSLYLIDILPSETMICELVFHPRSVQTYSFRLPVCILGSVSQPTISVETEGVPSPITINRMGINFKNKVVFRDTGSSGISHLSTAAKDTFNFESNLDGKPIEWWFDLEPLEDSDNVFKLDPSRGVLPPGESQTIIVSFQPETTGVYESVLPLHMDYLGAKAPFMITLQGTGVEPSLAFDPPEIFLPVVPSGSESTAIFNVVNYGCERTEIKYNIQKAMFERHGSLDLIFPEGRLLKSDGEKLTVVAKFAGNAANPPKPFSFMTKIEFCDNNGRTFYLPVSGAFDTCILSLPSYLWINRASHHYVESEATGGIRFESIRPEATLDENQKRTRILSGPRPFKTPCGITLENGADLAAIDVFLRETGDTLARWLDDHLGVSTALETPFPTMLTNGNGKVIFDLVQSISGRKVLGLASAGALSTNADDKIKILYKQYVDLLDQLAAVGGLVSSVRAEYLLSCEDFKRCNNQTIEALKSDHGGYIHDEQLEQHRRVERYFGIISKENWIVVLAQIIRVYVAQMQSLKHFRALQGVQKDEADLDWKHGGPGDIYSVSEFVLLKWVSYHSWKRTGVVKRLLDFSQSFKGCTPLMDLLVAHIPSLQQLYFSEFNRDPVEQEEILNNATMITAALCDLYPNCSGVNIPLHRLLEPDYHEIYLLLLFLYQTLPSFIPKGTIEFRGQLHERVTHSIELFNPASRVLSYTYSIVGCPHFEITNEQALSLSPKSSTKIEISFKSRFSRNVEAQLILKSKKMGFNNASIVVFNLVGFVTGSNPKKAFRMECPIYALPPATTDIPITNPFPEKGHFFVRIRQYRYGLHECIIEFLDDNLGEFSYRIDGRATLPQPLESYQWTCKASLNLEKPVRVIPMNVHRDKAVHYILHTPTVSKTHTGGKTRIKEKASSQLLDRDQYTIPKRSGRFKVEYSSQYFHGPAEILVKAPSDMSVKDKKNVYNVDQNYTELPITFTPQLPGKYVCKVVLSSVEASDVRVFLIYGIAMSEGTKADLEFTTPARQPITQDIPIVNRTEEDWTIKAGALTNYPLSFCPTKAGEVHGVLTLSNLQTAQKYIYNLHGFALNPLAEEHRAIKSEARTIQNEVFMVRNYTEHDSEYDVVTDIPHASGDAVIFVPAGQTVEYKLSIVTRNSGEFTKSITFTNKNDGSFVWYTVQVGRSAQRVASDTEYTRLSIKPPNHEGTIKIASPVRTAVAAEIPLANPLDEEIEYQVAISGVGLRGEPTVRVGPKCQITYSLIYAPIVSNVSIGSIKFRNDAVGEFWYQLDLESTDLPPIPLTEMSCPLGKCAFQLVTIENPFDYPIVLELRLSNITDFQVVHPVISAQKLAKMKRISLSNTASVTLEPFERSEVQLIFWPSSLTEIRQGSLHIMSSAIGNTEYLIKGRGLLPETMEEFVVSAELDQTTTSVLVFTNPLVDPIPVKIALKPSDAFSGSASDFALILNKKSKYSVGGLENLEIPFNFTPKTMGKASAQIVVEMSEKLAWVYPIRGIAETSMPHQLQVLECRSREKIERHVEYIMIGYNDIADGAAHKTSGWNTRTRFALECSRDVNEEEVKTSLAWRITEGTMTREGLVLRFNVTYSPIRPIETLLSLVITQNSTGSRWKYPLRLIARPPAIDDVIVVEGAINKVSTVNFVLKNMSALPRQFRAYFTHESPIEFQVSPSTGSLVPERDRRESDNMFVIGYKPIAYGKTLIGTLMIEAEDISWTYEVRGATPHYHQPAGSNASGSRKGSGSRTTSKAPVSKKNFVRDASLNPSVRKVLERLAE
ncbi:uncharacterized protein BJ171DRAFT_615867 [Polychytrium aggregatum]|uniref:uncharacterized protein n=1 Tax=Polychytrium aggregatum TaxID=110093 RepID=UPI0022FDF53F|nr:uncharacterized protein BJ171DRAFT_615867 [Polychytrium aggregatum]KAI9205277.1 hypothetical protein BJ171DRAFT_615867 [Polychytrium aggregatum]